MCGIAGLVSLNHEGTPPLAEKLHGMCSTIIHRGPDEEGYDVKNNVGLGMRRLSIIDVEGGHQPYFNEDGSVRAVFNGEIYNFQELRTSLERKGHVFKTASDGEVIVHLWEEYQNDFPKFLNGMFGIALHDSNRNKLLLVRDRLGIKPLYYYLDTQHLVFGSELKVLFASELVPKELNVDALAQFLSWEYIPGKQTLVKGIFKLEPGNLLLLNLDHGSTSFSTWWNLARDGQLDPQSLPKSPNEWEDAIDAKLKECVQRRLISDVPLGAFLSGGVDSSLITAAMGKATTFSIGFDDPSYNELEWSKRVANHLELNHTVEIIRPNIVEIFNHLMNFMDDPIGDFSIFPTYLVSRLARKQVTVALSGDGGDELFGGYETYIAQNMANSWNNIPIAMRNLIQPFIGRLKPRAKKKGMINKAKRFIEGLDHDPNIKHCRWRLFVGNKLQRRLFMKSALDQIKTPTEAHILNLFQESGERTETDQLLYVDLKSYLSDNILVKVDRMSMACSLEARVPFLDHEMVELAFSMPSHLKIHKNRTKVLLKKIAARHVPSDCVYRSKEGFSIPIKNWLKNEFRPLMEELLAPKRLREDGIFQVDTIEQLKREQLSGESNHSHILWALLVFHDWRNRWKV